MFFFNLISVFFFLLQNGDLCISILHPPVDDPQSGELPCERWNPTQNVRTILLSVISLLNEPNTYSPANVDASVMYRRWRDSHGKDNEYPNIIRLVFLDFRSFQIFSFKNLSDGVCFFQLNLQYINYLLSTLVIFVQPSADSLTIQKHFCFKNKFSQLQSSLSDVIDYSFAFCFVCFGYLNNDCMFLNGNLSMMNFVYKMMNFG